MQDVPIRPQLPPQRRARHVSWNRREDLGGNVREGCAILLQNHEKFRIRQINVVEYAQSGECPEKWVILKPPQSPCFQNYNSL